MNWKFEILDFAHKMTNIDDKSARLKGIESKEEFEREKLNEKANLVWTKFKTRLTTTVTLKGAANGVFIATVCFICLQQCFSQVHEYLKYSTRLQVSHSFPSNTLWLLPGVTVCNNNRIRMEKLGLIAPSLSEQLENLTREIAKTDMASFTTQKRLDFLKITKSIVDKAVNTSIFIDDMTISDLIELSRPSMIKDINCREVNCENFRIVESFQAGPCYTMFYLGSLLEGVASGKAYDFNTSLLDGQRKIDQFAEREIAEIIIDFEPFQHSDFQRDVGGRLVIHSTGHIGSVRDMAHSILPGFSYDVIIQRYLAKRLPPPYKSMCFDYRRANSHHFTTREDSYPSVELDKTTCTRNCIARKTTQTCNCWPVEVPFYPGDPLINDYRNYRMCPWSFRGSENYSASRYIECYKKFYSECHATCRPGCETEDYRVHVMSTPWPNAGMWFRANKESDRRRLLELKVSTARISLKYLELLETQHIMQPSMTLAQMVSNIGGIVSALIGVSVVTIYRYITRRVFHCKVVSDYTPTDKQAAREEIMDDNHLN